MPIVLKRKKKIDYKFFTSAIVRFDCTPHHTLNTPSASFSKPAM